jgi:AcrR family transcriptional regulator
MTQPSVPRPLPQTARGRKTREELLRAAEEVFGAKGFDNASITDITQRAGVAQGTFYVHFEDKRAIFVELVEALGTGLREEIRQALEGLTNRLDVEREGFRAFFRYSAQHRGLYRIVRQAEFVDEEVFRAYYRRMAEGYVRGLRRAMDAKQLRRMDPEILAYCLMGIADFLGLRWVLWEQGADLDRLVEAAMSFVQQGIQPSSPVGPAGPRSRKPRDTAKV